MESSAYQLIQPKPKRYVILCGLCLAGGFLASGLGSGLGWLSFALIPFFWIQFKTSSILLDHEGFTFRSLGRSHRYKWTDIRASEGFFVVTQRVNLIKVNSLVGWRFDSSYRKLKVIRAVTGAVTGTEATIDPLGHDAKAIARLMTEFLQRATAGTPAITVIR